MLSRAKEAMLQTSYIEFYYNEKIQDDIMLFESKHGKDLAGNIFSLLRKVTQLYPGQYRIFLTCVPDRMEKTKKLLNTYGIGGVTLTDPRSKEYYTLLACAKYLFNDTSFTTRYIKKEGQVVVNTWHGTPLKVMGRDVEDSAYSMGNIQRNLLFSDYLIYPNLYMKEKMVDAYMLDGVYQGTILNAGYPRNSIFFDREAGQAMKEKIGLKGKTVYVYMPTWRGNLVNMKNEKQIDILTGYLKQLDEKLRDEEVLLTKLHPFVGADLDYSEYKHIRPMPSDFETYDVLNCADCLITDYSSVFYDFANTGRKIILFTYDEEEYMSERGVYMSLEELPFPKVRTADALYDELQCPKNYDDREFLQYCCTYENPQAAEKILRRVLEGETACGEEHILDTSKENVLIFAGSLAKNGITTAVLNLLDNLDTERRRYFITFQTPVVKEDPFRVSQIPRTVRILPMPSKPHYTVTEAMAMIRYYKMNQCGEANQTAIDRMCERDIIRFFGGIRFDTVIQYEGYGKNMIHLFQAFSCRKIIFVHNNMLEELATKKNQHRKSLEKAYQDYDRVACVTSSLVPPTEEISGRSDNIYVVHNCHSYLTVREKAEEEIRFDEDTLSTVPLEKLKEILQSKDRKIINIGRFSAEKGHDLLIEAFTRFHKDDPNVWLIIIGGYGQLYEQTLQMAKKSSASERIIVIHSVSNPMPILKRCDLFILSSRYEGLGLTLLEADALDVPVISTNVCGPSGFMKENGGFMVEPTAEGIYKGMIAFEEGKIHPLYVDYAAYNQNAVEQFEQLLQF